MEKYKLLKDLPNAMAGEVFELTNTGLGHPYGDGTINWFCLFNECELKKFDILNPDKGWFEKIEEKKYGGRVPKVGDIYWAICADGAPFETFWRGMNLDKDRFESGSAFWACEEAEKELKRRKAYVVLKEDTKGFVPDWNDGDERKYFVGYNLNRGFAVEYNWFVRWTAGPYFATEKDAQASIKAHRQLWFDYLGIEEEA